MSEYQDKEPEIKINSGGWSQTGFSFITAFSVALVFSYLTSPVLPDFRKLLVALVLSSLFSVFYFLKNRKQLLSAAGSWKRTELMIYILFLVQSVLILIINPAELIIAASSAGIILLIITDLQYSVTEKKVTTFFHSGQNLLTALIIASFLSGLKWPFVFIAVIKLLSSIYYGYKDKSGNLYFSLRILRIALLLAAGVSLVTEISNSDPVIAVMFLCGELIDRIYYYHDLENKYKPL